MALVTLIIDSRQAYLDRLDSSLSLLSLPLGTSTVLGDLMARIREVKGTQVWVVPANPWDRQYEQAIERDSHGGAEIIAPERFTSALHAFEPSDVVVVLDPCHWPANGFDLAALLEQRPDDRWAVHAVSLGKDLEGMLEDVQCDLDGCVNRVRRYYDMVTWPKAGPIWASAAPLSALEGVSFFSPSQLRAALSARGILSQDVSVSSSSTDLTQERGILALSEAIVAEQAAAELPPPGYTVRTEGVLVGPHCRIHPSARLIGPIIVQPDVTIDEDVTVIGPTVIGVGSRVRRDCVIAQCLLAGKATLDRGVAVRQQVVGGRYPSRQPAERNEPGDDGLQAGPSLWRQSVREPALADMREATHRHRVYMAAKLVFDTILAVLAVLLLSPLFLAIALAVKLDSRGPVFYRDRREGKDGRVFSCLKFRTMSEDADQTQRRLYAQSAVDGPQFKLREDPRVTRAGRWLRSTNLDELPQLLNVVAGQMSLVGPRPSPFRENQICVPWRRARLSVRPGITGLWQICRHDRGEGDFHQWIAYDIAYVRNMSLWLDFKILLATVLTLGGRWNIPESRMLAKRRSAPRSRATVAAG